MREGRLIFRGQDVEVDGEVAKRKLHYRAGTLIVLKRPGRSASNLLHRFYQPATFEVWEARDHLPASDVFARRIATFPAKGGGNP